MSDKDLKDKERRLLEMFIKAYIDEKRFYEILERIHEGK